MKLTLNKNRQTAIILSVTYLTLVIYAILEQVEFFGPDLGLINSLKLSGFTRAMFLDIGILATLAAFWVMINGRGKYKILIAIGVLVLGSFVLLPYLIYLFWNNSKLNQSK